MPDNTLIKTERLILRPWRQEDLEPFAKLNADPRVMEHFPAVKSFEETAAEYNGIVEHFAKHGWGFWAVEVPNKADFIGFIGLRFDDFPAPFTPCVEIGWRLGFDTWGNGYATEGAIAALKIGFETLKLDEIVSFTAVPNLRSQSVMQKIGMHHSPADDFNHPKLPEGHKLRRHVLYRLNQDTWQRKNQYG